MGVFEPLRQIFSRLTQRGPRVVCNSIDEIADVVEDFTMAYYEANGYAPFRRDILVQLGLDGELEKRFRRGEQPESLDAVLFCMVAHKSLRGAQICVEAGADPAAVYVVDDGGGEIEISAIDCAEDQQFHKIADFLADYVGTPLYRQRMALREANNGHTSYWPDFIPV